MTPGWTLAWTISCNRACILAGALTDAEQAALSVDLDGDGHASRRFFNLSAQYARLHDFRVDPRGQGLHGILFEPGEVVRLTRAPLRGRRGFRGECPLEEIHDGASLLRPQGGEHGAGSLFGGRLDKTRDRLRLERGSTWRRRPGELKYHRRG